MADFDTAGEWANNVGEILGAHLNTQRVVDNAQAMADQAAQGMQRFKDGAANYVERNPQAVGAVLQTVPHTVAAAFAHADPAQAEDGAVALTRELGQHIATAAVRGAADVNEAYANHMLDRVGDLIPADQHDDLRGHAAVMAGMRQADFEAGQREGLRQIGNGDRQVAQQYLSALSDPTNGQLRFPPAWGQRMARDPRLLPTTQATLMRAYAQLQGFGEPQAPDPDVITRTLSAAVDNHPGTADHPSVAQVILNAGKRLSAQDTAWLAGRVGPQDAEGRQENRALVDVLGQARQTIGNQNAYGRFVSWFLPAYRDARATGAPWQDMLSPQSKGYVLAPERAARFMPTGDDMIRPAQQATPRRSLKEIFGG